MLPEAGVFAFPQTFFAKTLDISLCKAHDAPMTSTATHTVGRTCAITDCYPFAEAANDAARWLASTIEGATL